MAHEVAYYSEKAGKQSQPRRVLLVALLVSACY